jgi:hypothetical protein
MFRSRLAVASLTAAALLLGGCDVHATAAPKTVDWAAIGQEHMNCPRKSDKVTPIREVRHDVDGDDHGEWFAMFRCGVGQPAQLEVYPGDSDPASSRRIDRLVHITDDPSRLLDLDAGCLYFTGKRVIIRGVQYAAGGLTVLRVATWNGKNFQIQPDLVSSSVAFPGCG